MLSTIIITLAILENVCGILPHPSVKDRVGEYLKSAPWQHTKTFAKINTPISMDITSNYKLPGGTVLKDIKDVGQSRDCEEILKRNPHTRGIDGVYTIYPDKKNPIKVYCDMTTDGGGWTVIQRRFYGQTNFDRNWNDYKRGFGDVGKEYWLGNDNSHTLTSGRNQELRIDMEKFTGTMVYARYSHFSVGSESSKYRLSISSYSGDAGDMMTSNHDLNGSFFSTKDRNNDRGGGRCTRSSHAGAWWYDNCTYSDLNGVYQPSNKRNRKGLFWGRNGENMKTTRMMIRSKN